jgi:putative tryptophan/tyrosine transport system substrate-binding protein
MRLIGLAVVLALSLTLAPIAADGQQESRVHRIGFLGPRAPSETMRFLDAFRQGLSDLGWVAGKNITIEYRFAEGKVERLPDLAAELLGLKVEIVVAEGGAVQVVQRMSKTIPIVMAEVTAPVEQGFVQSLARPGGNITGSAFSPQELRTEKNLELLKEIVPKLSRVAVLWAPRSLTGPPAWKNIQLAARQLGVQLHSLEVESPNDLDKAFKEATTARVDALVALLGGNLKQIADLAAKSRLPAIHSHRTFAESGGLVTYGADVADLFRRAARYVDKILKGAKPADLPVEQPTKFELVINLKTAKALGLTIPQTLLLRADQLIE